MLSLLPASKLILRHSNRLKSRLVLFAGDLQDILPAKFTAVNVSVHANQYNYWKKLSSLMSKNCFFSLSANNTITVKSNAMIYYWPKSKQEAKFNLYNLFSFLPIGTELFIVGENHSGVRSAEGMIEHYGSLKKIDSAFHCALYHGFLKKQSNFNLADWWSNYQIGSLSIATLPGVFSFNKLDIGSKILLSIFQSDIKGKILDVGCGAGVLSAVIGKISPRVNLTLIDVSAPALAASQMTLTINSIQGKVIPSDIYSNVKGCFDIIISNPPFHNSTQISLTNAKKIIYGAPSHLRRGGKLCIVANSFLPYAQMLDNVFGAHQVLVKTRHFKVYVSYLNGIYSNRNTIFFN
ncbi:16S rRNA (guanine(1207)-N(2))-methyltransferase RsmC [Candidatus Profftia sp. (ex Adelges kitamiensis)]|uniref:16S rRNA (guanine(1207)-N(2))-methyltransferase RsmC n=1 Tax=Candidatus Profftia sp. (ex Adelges kitamiensis) TaxID=2864218 RepID=UPI001CE28C19|nr:16S rRNA (guanine(1207)-N(2))-methyltransferase RsmC [Candidatus Profftia sp. (ex Adelges kitamiensis)]